MSSVRVALIASARHPITEPFAGGLEAHTWGLAHALTRRGHEVDLFAAPGSDPALGACELPVRHVVLSAAARSDASMPSTAWIEEHHAYLSLMLDLARDGEHRFDVVHNNSLHYLPVAMASALRVPVITTLHTPPTPWLESAIQSHDVCPVVFTAVSQYTASAWHPVVPEARVVRNGIDTDFWRPGPGGSDLAWSGRIVPEKGPHLAIRAARAAGVPLKLAGPVSDERYYEEEVAPLLGDGAEYVGHLDRHGLAELLAHSAAALVTPSWDEPYGLVVAEALACGTPVCGFDRGALAEILTPACGLLAPPGDVAALAALIPRVMELDRGEARRRAERFCSLGRTADAYTRLYEEVAR
ncbi:MULTISPECIES: glycosyltransferase [Streptomyces]|uniref:D-inositol 3-phosphate glycosyltransferase n=2 Tax=Streptomyces TaxID=1883 RepID=A0A5P2BM84_STRVZ|nr:MULTISPECIES: glycosyltransferase [Streptomyces]MYY81287.1 glycosyltransferase [Streptomyces sp. SID335]MYZ12949.1 glycosyltransferase [Streptomyces sp. SID337]NEB43176.1 glycosyltransferase family 4 protein [Streptomyces sp. SID339]QES30221.1 glycosyltransferase family 4 protein [Streptomyces venezuelae]